MARLVIPAVLAALAAMAIAIPGVASAADYSVSISCTPATVDAGKSTSCLTIVTSNNSSVPAATGEVGFFVTGWTGFFDHDQTCQLVLISPRVSSCTLPVTGYAPGEENVVAYYPAVGPVEDGSGSSSEITIRGGSMRVFCEDPVIVVGEQTECQAFVPTAPGAPPASGSVAFRSTGRFSVNSAPGDVEPECELEPAAEGAGCSVTFATELFTPGEFAVLGEYEGDLIYPADHGTGFTAAVDRHKTAVETTCDPHQPLLSTLIKCTTTVTSIWPPTGPAPIGNVVSERESPSAGSFPNTPSPASSGCHVKPVAVRQSACTVVYRPEALGAQTLKGNFYGEIEYESNHDFFALDVKKGLSTATKLDCEEGRVGVFRKCTATVTDVEGNPPVSPTGSVSFSGNATFSSDLCKLAPSSAEAGVTRCEVSYRPSAVGSLTLRADYESGGSTHRPSKAETSVQVLPAF